MHQTVNCLVRRLICLPIFALLAVTAFAQKNQLKGTVIDTAEKTTLKYAIIALIDKTDTTLYRSVRADGEGKFSLSNIPAGRYTVMISYPKMADFLQDIVVTDTSVIDLAKVAMTSESQLLEEVVVRAGRAIRNRGDTLEYTADSFAVRPGDNVESLLKRLPGVQVDRKGKITAQGEAVKKVLVDGDEFFSDDPGMATRYLRADAIDKVQVYDKKSEQAEFTGIDDGLKTKTINLKLKRNKKNGLFGKVSAGGDAKDFYQYEALAALFNGPRKMAVYGQSAKTGSPGEASEWGQYSGRDMEYIDDGTGSLGFVGTQAGGGGESVNANGIPSVLTGKVNFANKWNEARQSVVGNYKIHEMEATGWSNTRQTNVLPDGTGFFNKSAKNDKGYALSHSGDGSFSFALDSFSSMKISVNGNMNKNESYNVNLAESNNLKNIQVNNSKQLDSSLSEKKDFGTNLRYQKKFRKRGRTLSISLQQSYARNDNDKFNYTTNNYFDPETGAFKNADTLDQLQDTRNTVETYGAKAVYSDRVGQVGVQAEYGFVTTTAGNMFNTLRGNKGIYKDRIDSLSNDYTFTSNTHISAITASWMNTKFRLTLASKVFLTGFDQVDNDLQTKKRRNFINFAPNVSFNYSFSRTNQLNVNYSGNTSQPSVDQLQPLRRTNNPLYVQIGNPDLRPGFNQNLSVNYSLYNFKRESMLMGGVGISLNKNGIISVTSVDAQNRQVSKYINMDGLPGINGSLRYNWRMKALHLRPAVIIGIGRNASYQIQNDQKIKNENTTMNAGLSLQHEWKDVLSTSVDSRISASTGKSSIPGQPKRSQWSHSHSIDNTVTLPFRIDLTSRCDLNFQPKNSSFSKSLNTVRWDAFVEKKFLKSGTLVAKLEVRDIFNNNQGYNRFVDGFNTTETEGFVLKRFFMATLSWGFLRNL